MQRQLILVSLVVALFLASGVLPAASSSPALEQAMPLATPCTIGVGYDPACDVDQDGDVDIFDIQLAAGHWNQSGTFTSDNNHNHLGQTWTGSNNPLQIAGSFGLPNFAPLVLYNNTGKGLLVDSVNSIGVHVNHANGTGVAVSFAGDDGVAVLCAGNFTSCASDSVNANGFEVGFAEDYGVKVVRADRAAFRSDSSGTNGLYVATAGDSGVWIADATNWAGWFTGDVNITGSCTGCLIAQMAVNSGDETLQPGEIVAVDGVTASPFDGLAMLLQVHKAAPGSAVVGVVGGRAEPHTSQEDGHHTLVPRHGEPAAPGDYLLVVIYGPVQVKAAHDVQLGDRVTVADGLSGVRALSTFQVQRTDGGTAAVVEAAPVLGVTLDAAHDGLVWVLVNPQ